MLLVVLTLGTTGARLNVTRYALPVTPLASSAVQRSTASAKTLCTASSACTATHARARASAVNMEPYQVMAYGPNEKYVSHVDFYDRDSRFFGNDVTKFGGQRIMTALLYLTTCDGGETVFRKGPVNDVGAASCAKKCALTPAALHLAVRWCCKVMMLHGCGAPLTPVRSRTVTVISHDRGYTSDESRVI